MWEAESDFGQVLVESVWLLTMVVRRYIDFGAITSSRNPFDLCHFQSTNLSTVDHFLECHRK